MSNRSRAAPASGFSLIEVVVAVALLTIGVLAAARLFTASTAANAAAKTVTQATVLALEKMEQLRASSIDDPALQPSPPDALTSSVEGYSDRPDVPFVRRWSIEPLPSYPDDGVVVRVAVLRPDAPGRALVEMVRTRKPAGAIPD